MASPYSNGKVYIHEFIDITLQNRAKYIHHMTANWGPIGRTERNQLCFGVWATVGSSERWPQVTNLWELDGWKGMARNFSVEFDNPKHQDPSLEAWWAEAANYRSGGYDRLLVGAPYSPSIEQAIARGIKGRVYYHELIQTAPGQARTYLELMEKHWLPIAERIGLNLAFAARHVMVNDSEVVCIWAMKDWETWADVEIAYEEDDGVTGWRRMTKGIAIDWRNKLLSPAPLCPLNTGTIL